MIFISKESLKKYIQMAVQEESQVVTRKALDALEEALLEFLRRKAYFVQDAIGLDQHLMRYIVYPHVIEAIVAEINKYQVKGK